MDSKNTVRKFEFDGEAQALLKQHDLPVKDLPDENITFYELVRDDTRVGIGAIESRGDVALLRSVAIKPEFQGRELGTTLVQQLIESAREDSVQVLYLLTTTAESFFQKLGFRTVNRDQAPTEIENTEEFQNLCSDSALLMKREIG